MPTMFGRHPVLRLWFTCSYTVRVTEWWTERMDGNITQPNCCFDQTGKWIGAYSPCSRWWQSWSWSLNNQHVGELIINRRYAARSAVIFPVWEYHRRLASTKLYWLITGSLATLRNVIWVHNLEIFIISTTFKASKLLVLLLYSQTLSIQQIFYIDT